METQPCAVTADPLGNQAGWVAIAVNEQHIQPNVYALLKQLKDSCILNTSLNAKTLVIFSKGKSAFKRREGIHLLPRVLSMVCYTSLLLHRACSSKVSFL